MSLGSGALLDFEVAPYEGKETGEQALLRKLLSHLNDGDILLGDANFENTFYWLFCFRYRRMWFSRKTAHESSISESATRS